MLNRKKQKAIELILKGISTVDISKEIAVSRMTLYRWKKEDEEFKQELEEKQEEIRQEMKNKFLNIAYTKGIKSLEKIVDGSKNPIAQVQAIKELFSLAGFTPDNNMDINFNSEKIVFIDDVPKPKEGE
jgi:DNA invertase Pin-like site-specific DNA recombinase